MDTVQELIKDFFEHHEGVTCLKSTFTDKSVDVILECKEKQIPFKFIRFTSDTTGNDMINIESNGEFSSVINAIESKQFRYFENIFDILELMNKMLTESHKHCIICGEYLEYPSDIPIACGNKTCQYKAEEMFVGDEIVMNTLKNSPEVFKFLIQSSIVAINSPHCETRLEPFPTRFLIGNSKDRYIRGEFSSLSGVKINKDIARLRNLTKSFPNIEKHTGSEQELKDFLGDDLYYLIRFIIKSNCTHLEPVNLFGEKQLQGIQQFKIRHSIDVEENFNKKFNKEHCFLFHGSSEENWHSILRNGLKNCSGTKLQSNGAAHGKGIYLSDNFTMSINYSRGSLCVFGVCQVVGNKSKYKKTSSIYVADENSLLLRYLFVGSRTDMMKINARIFDAKFGFIVEETKSRDKILTNRGNNRLMKELSELQRDDIKEMGFVIKSRNDDLFTWDVYMTEFDSESPITSDLKKRGITHVHVEISFPTTGQKYPFTPPFVRVVSPRFQFHTGHITVGGSFCIELLTQQGWSSVYKIESLLVQLKALVLAGGARLDEKKWNINYDVREAKGAFTRVARQHGWM